MQFLGCKNALKYVCDTTHAFPMGHFTVLYQITIITIMFCCDNLHGKVSLWLWINQEISRNFFLIFCGYSIEVCNIDWLRIEANSFGNTLLVFFNV